MSLPSTVEKALSNGHALTTKALPANPSIYRKMNLVMLDIGAIGKDQKNQAQGFKFRGIDQFVNALYPALTKHGVFMAPRVKRFDQTLQEVTRSSGKVGVDKHVAIEMEYTFYAEDGSSVTVSVPGEGLDSGDKATNKALSAALKYALIQTFSIPTEDMAEADLESPEIGTPKVVAKIPGTDLADARSAVIATAQALVARKKITKEALLLEIGVTGAITVTDAVNQLGLSQLGELSKKLEGKLNGK